MSKQPEAIRLAANLSMWPSREDLDESSRELLRLHALNGELLEALKDLTLNVSEAMKTGGWVPTPLHASFWEAMSVGVDVVSKAEASK